METNNSLEIVRHQIITETQAASYQKLLQVAENIVFDKNSLNMDYLPLKELGEIEKRLKEKENPHTAAWKQFNEAKASILNPITEILMRKRNEFSKLANEIKAEKQKTDSENKRIADIKKQIVDTTLSFSQRIASATIVNELVVIEKAIGTEKTKKEYQEFTQELKDELDKLRPLIFQQKENLKQLGILYSLTKNAETTGNDETLLEAIEKKLEIETKISNLNNSVQSLALESAMKSEDVVSESTVTAPKPRRQTWEWQIVDAVLLQRRHPEWFELLPRQVKIDEHVKELKLNKTIKECVEDGLKIYQHSIY